MAITTIPDKLGSRHKSFGHDYEKSLPDKFGHWLSTYQIRRAIPTFRGKAVGDFGCGYDALFVRPHLEECASATLVDVTLADDLKAMPNVKAIEGTLPSALEHVPTASLDVVLCNNVLEHLSDPRVVLEHFRRVTKSGGVCFFNVPSWRGKFFLEILAFRLNMTPPAEIDEHKNYYDTRAFWTLLVSAGFKPSEITCHTHKFGLNTFAVCRIK